MLALLSTSLFPANLETGEGSDPFGSSLSVEEYVRVYFEDIPQLAEVADCESRFRHFNARGTVLRGEVNRLDVGVMQINEKYHLETATKFGYDIHTLHGNLEYARNLFERKGLQPWVSSKPCWDKKVLALK